MKTQIKQFALGVALILPCFSFAQIEEIKLNPEKVKQFTPYLQVRHGGVDGFEKWKSVNKLLYTKEMWYFSESFSVKRNYSPDGDRLDESMIDISRFERYRKQDEEAIVPMPGFKDALVLIPANQLIYKP
jgi:hypothetical protein